MFKHDASVATEQAARLAARESIQQKAELERLWGVIEEMRRDHKAEYEQVGWRL